MRSLLRIITVIAILLGVPLLTAALWSGPLEQLFARWQQSPPPAIWLALGLIAVLAADILLPVPSGPVITLAGGQLGTLPTTAAAWTGLMLGGIAAFAITKRWGRPLAERLAPPDELGRLRDAARRHDVWLLLVTRPLPILAEATVLVCGTLDTSWWRLLWTLAAGNAVVALAFALLGSQAEEHEWMMVAIVLSVVVPLAGTWMLRQRLKQPTGPDPRDDDAN